MDIYLSAEFSSYKEFTSKFHNYCKVTGQAYRIDWSRTVNNFNKTVLERSANVRKKHPVIQVDPSWQYTHLNYVCVHGGRHRLYRAKLKNPAIRTLPGVCPASLLVAYNRLRDKLVVVRANPTHNHGLNTPQGYVPRTEVARFLFTPNTAKNEEQSDDDDLDDAGDREVTMCDPAAHEEIAYTVTMVDAEETENPESRVNRIVITGEPVEGDESEYEHSESEISPKKKSKENLIIKPKLSKRKKAQPVKMIRSSERKTPKRQARLQHQKLTSVKKKTELSPDEIATKITESPSPEKMFKAVTKSKPVVPDKNMHVTINVRDPDEEELGLVAKRCNHTIVDPEQVELLSAAVEALTAHLKQSHEWEMTDDWYFKNLIERLKLPANACWTGDDEGEPEDINL